MLILLAFALLALGVYLTPRVQHHHTTVIIIRGDNHEDPDGGRSRGHYIDISPR
jgi:hypothetical protein